MGLPAVQRVSSKKVIELKSLKNVSNDFLIPEILNQTTEWGLEENRAQAELKPPNMASRVVLDRRHLFDLKREEAKRLAQAKKVRFVNLKSNIRFLYTDTEVLARAVEAAYWQLRDLTAQASGFTIGTYYFYLADYDVPSRSKVTYLVDTAVEWIKRASSGNIWIALLGPTAGDRRERIYNPRGARQELKWVSPTRAARRGKEKDRYKFFKPRETRVGRDKEGSLYARGAYERGKGVVLKATRTRKRATYQVGVARAIQEMTMMRIRRQYRDVRVNIALLKVEKTLRT